MSPMDGIGERASRVEVDPGEERFLEEGVDGTVEEV